MSRIKHCLAFFLASCLLLLAETPASGDAAPILTLDGNPIPGTYLGSFVEFVEDERADDQFESIRADWKKLPLQHKESDHITLGAAAKPHWFRFVIQLKEPQKIILEHDYPVDLLDIFHRSPNGSDQRFQLGYKQESPSRLDYRYPTKVLDLEAGFHEFYLRLEHKGAVRFSLRVWSNEMFVLAKTRHELALGIILGISILMVFYNIFLYAMIRSKVYLHYVGYLCSQTFFLLFYSGLSLQLGPPFKWLFNNFWISSILLTAFFLQRFTRVFLNLPGRMPRFDSVFVWSSYFLLGAAVLEQFNQNWAFMIFHIALIPSMLLCLTGATLSAFRGYRPAWFYLIAFVVVIVGGAAENLVVAELIDPKYSFWVYFSTYSLQMVLLSLAIGDQIHLEQTKTLKTVEHLSKNLQEEVKSQTLKLEIQRDKLIEQKKELAQAHEELQNHDKQKTRFFENISHELRTPLTLILGSLSHARQELASCKPVQVADRNAKRLLRLVNQLLDFQKLNSGEAVLDLRKIDLMTFLNSICQYFQPVCEQKKVRFQLDLGSCSEKDRPFVMVQIDALEKIVFNYLSNALKFTPQGGEIYLRFVQIGSKARVQVDDSGPGIAPDELGHLFRVFSQGNGSAKQEFEGTGLGLALAKELAHQMGGEVGVHSEPGRGSSFWVDLPLCLDRKRTLDLLAIDTDPVIREQLEDSLHQHQVCESFRVVGSPQEAREIMSHYRVHCVLCDAMMPDDGGLSLISYAAEEQPQSKRLLMTSHADSHSTVQKIINTVKIDHIFYKPFDESILLVLKAMIEEAKIHHSNNLLDVLVIDDEESVLRSMQSMLMSSDTIETIMLIKDLDEARQTIRSHKIRCVLVDANLAAVDGTDFLVEIAQLQPDCHRMMITGETSPQLLEKAINKAKVDHVIYKPIRKQELLDLVEKALRDSAVVVAPAETPEVSLVDYQPKDWHLADVPLHESVEATFVSESDHPDRDESILVVDDVEDMRDLIRSVLVSEGYRVLGASNGEEALKVMQRERVDLIITDWMMPKKSGPELLADLQKDRRLAGIPSILLTARGDDISKMMATKEGVSAYLSKPFNEMELRSTVANLLKLKQGERKIAELNRDLTENVLKRFLPPHLVNEIASGHKEFMNEARLCSVTILFADLCNFTKTSEDQGPRKIAKILNHYFDAMTKVIFANGGTIDKFIGDAIMVIFGAPESMEAQQQIANACACALRMQEVMEELNQSWQKDDSPRLQMRIGIHHGSAIVGMFGGEQRADYTAIGPVVNLASRVEAVARPGEVFITGVIRDYMAEDNWEKAGNYDLKGIGEQVPLYRLSLLKQRAA